MIKTVARSYPWASPDKINEMFCDDEDYFGLDFWYKDVQEQHEEMNKK